MNSLSSFEPLLLPGRRLIPQDSLSNHFLISLPRTGIPSGVVETISCPHNCLPFLLSMRLFRGLHSHSTKDTISSLPSILESPVTKFWPKGCAMPLKWECTSHPCPFLPSCWLEDIIWGESFQTFRMRAKQWGWWNAKEDSGS